MFARSTGKLALLTLVALALGGCFREAGPGLEPTTNTVATQAPVLSPTPADVSPTPFVTPFVPAGAPDATEETVSPTAPVEGPGAAGGDTAETPAEQGTPELDQGILPTGDSSGGVPPTAPFAAGPTYTPIPGVPPVSANPALQPTPTEIGATLANRDCFYTVEVGDTMTHIASLYEVTVSDLMDANDLDNADYLYEGQELRIPGCGETPPTAGETEATPSGEAGPGAASPTPRPPAADGSTIHVVQRGENLFRIALRYGVTVDEIVAANNLGSADAVIYPDQELIIPAPSP